MKNLFNLIFYYICLILLTTVKLSAQEQPTQQNEPSKEDVITYKISEIPIKLEETSAYLSDLYNNVLKPDEVKSYETELTNILAKYSVLKSKTDSVTLDNQLTTSLKEFRQLWSSQQKAISDWADEITSGTEQLEEQKKTLIQKKAIWLRTDSLARTEKANRNIRNKISEILAQINQAENLTVNEINNSLNLQTKLSKQSVDVNLTVEKIDKLLLAKKREIFVRNAPPIWKSFVSKKDTLGISRQVKDIWDSYIRTARDFYVDNKEESVNNLIYFLILFSLVLILKYYTKNLKSDDEKVKRALVILKTPFSSTILISIFVIAIIYADAPEIFRSIIKIIIVFPLLIVLYKLINKSLRVPLYIFAVLFILQQFKLTSASDTEIERVLLIVINLIALSGLIWMLLTKKFRESFTKQSLVNKARALAKTVIVVFSISLLANILGFVMLSVTLINGTINSIFSIIVLTTAGIVLEGVLIIFLHTKSAEALNVVKNYPEKIETTLGKILKLVIVSWSIVIVLNNFGLREIVFDWLGETLGHKWSIGSFSITLGNVIIFIISIWLAVMITRFVRFILEGDVLPRLNLPRGVPGAISIMSSYLIIGFGIVVAIMSAGIDLSSFALLAGALGVGIGFGLQNIVNNFISGLILIFERPIQIGDAVQIEDLSGRVTHIGIRSSTIKTWDGAEVIVPNGNLISNKLVNWTLSDQRRRINIMVGVAYGTDVGLVMETLLNCAKHNERIIEYPAPSVLFEDFADSSLNFELRCWTSDFSSWVEIRSELRVAIDKAFKENNIEIPFPQRDLHLKSGFDFSKPVNQKQDNLGD